MKTRPVAVLTDEGREVHIPNPGGGDYMTLCGLDGNDPRVGQYGVEACRLGEVVTCDQCKQLYLGVKSMSGLRFKS